MKHPLPESTVMSTSCSPAKRLKLNVSRKTTVNVDDIAIAQDSAIIPRSYQTIQSIVDDLKLYLREQKEECEKIEHDLVEVMLMTDYLGENLTEYNARSVDYTAFLQSKYVNLPRLKHYLDNLLHIGYELGIYGLFLAAKALQKTLKSSQALELITDEKGKELFDSSMRRIDCLTDDILQNLIHINQHNDKILFSSKVLNVFYRIKQDVDSDSLGRCIVFVQRIYTAIILNQLLNFLSERFPADNTKRLKIKYLTGQKSSVGSTAMTAIYQRQTIKEFQAGAINVLVATAVVEEGLDIPKCNLVFRFNRPPNFSSYMQSKGRARAKQNASYCTKIGNGQLCPPRILYHKAAQSNFKSVLSMPANCPVREDIVIPLFSLCDIGDEILTVHITYVKTIEYQKYKNEFDSFCKYLFEHVFDGIIKGSQSTLNFNIERSSFKLLPCLLKSKTLHNCIFLPNNLSFSDYNEIDVERMLSICNRLNKPIENYPQLSDNELYVAWYLSHKPLYVVMPGDVPSKRTSDPWIYKRKLDTIKTYADYFQNKIPQISIPCDALMATMKPVSNPRINYLYPSSIEKKAKNGSVCDRVVYLPIELLHYAPLNQADMKLFYKLPSILIRLTQLYWTEQLRQLLPLKPEIYSVYKNFDRLAFR
ncbi:unnamed protein product [Rotaria sp. Silwood2]|nr:unnamed protein product [Rotaria sp. Silwood2]